MINTHEELVKLHGEPVTCKIHGTFIEDAKISVDECHNVFVCQNTHDGTTADDTLGYEYSWLISRSVKKHQYDDRNCTDIILKTKTKSTMTNLIDKLKLAVVKEPNKTLIKAGYMTSDGVWSDEVREVAMTQLIDERLDSKDFKDQIVELAKEEVEDTE